MRENRSYGSAEGRPNSIGLPYLDLSRGRRSLRGLR